MSETAPTSGLRVVTFNVLPVSYGNMTATDERTSAAPGTILDDAGGEMLVAVGDGAVRTVVQSLAEQ